MTTRRASRYPSPRAIARARVPRVVYVPALAWVLSAMGCEQAVEPAGGAARLADGVVAEVAGRPITTEMVLSAARAGGDLEATVARLVTAELFTAQLREDDPSIGRVAERGASARALLAELRAEALSAGGPITPEETAELVQGRWTEYARPRAVRTAHAVALASRPELKEDARALAERAAAAAEGVTDPDEFADRIRALANDPPLPDGLELRVEALPPVTEDGRTVAADALDVGGPPQLVTEYSQAAARLNAVGEQSPVVETQFGYHVLLAMEILPELRPTDADAAQAVLEEAISVRARPRLAELVSALRAAAHVEVARNATELTRAVEITR